MNTIYYVESIGLFYQDYMNVSSLLPDDKSIAPSPNYPIALRYCLFFLPWPTVKD